MSISVLNTDAGLSAKTIVSAEGATTVTGLITFDRDPSAPFAVTASSAVVTNLDADKLDGNEASAFLLLAGGTMTGNLLFTDATLDIGASGATRPRDLFLSRNAVIGGTCGVTGVLTASGGVTLGSGQVLKDGSTALLSLTASRIDLGGGYAGATNIAIRGVAGASISSGSATLDGTLWIDTTNHRFVFFDGGARYYVAGTSF